MALTKLLDTSLTYNRKTQQKSHMSDILPKAPPISAPFVGIFTLTIPQSEPNGLERDSI
jgi:hypothetical protein